MKDHGDWCNGCGSRHCCPTKYRARQDREPVWLGLILEQATDTLRCEPSAFRDYGLDNGGARYLGPVYEGPRGLVTGSRSGSD